MIVLIGTAGSGKSTFAQTHFLSTEILSSDFCRALISDDEANQEVTPHAFRLLHSIARKRLKVGRCTVIDATNVEQKSRLQLLDIARKKHAKSIAIVFNVPKEATIYRDKSRSRKVGAEVIHQQWELLQQSLPQLPFEGFDEIIELRNFRQINTVIIER